MRSQSEEDAYWEGYKAYLNEQRAPFVFAENPYNTWGEQEPLNEAWSEGYSDAGWDD